MATQDPNAKFQAVFPGLPGGTADEMKVEIRQKLIELFKLPPEKADELLNRANVVLRGNMDFATAQEFANRFRMAGLTVLVLPMGAGAPAPAAAPAGEIVACPGCARKNRVKSMEMLATAKCSVCGVSLAGAQRAGAPAAAPAAAPQAAPQSAPAQAPPPAPQPAPAAAPPPQPAAAPATVPDVVACPSCHAKNRVKSADALPTAKCAICAEKLQVACPKCSQPVPVETNLKPTCACGWTSSRTPEEALAFREVKKQEKEMQKLAAMAADDIEVISTPGAAPVAAPTPAAQPAAAAKPAGEAVAVGAIRALEDVPDALPEFLWNGLRDDLKGRVKCLKIA